MAFTPFDFDVLVHTKLGDDPNVDNNMTADQLKALFDSPMVAFKEWINNTLIPALNSFSPESSIAVFIQQEKPSYMPCIWFVPNADGSSDIRYVAQNGVVTSIYASVMDNTVSTAKIAEKAVTPNKLDRTYFDSGAPMILTQGVHYGDNLPQTGQPGQLFFKKVT